MARNDWRGDLQSYANLLNTDDENIILPVQDDGATQSPLHRRSGNTPAPLPHPSFSHPPRPYPPHYTYPSQHSLHSQYSGAPPPPYPYTHSQLEHSPPPPPSYYYPPPEHSPPPPPYYGFAPPTLRPCGTNTNSASESDGGASNTESSKKGPARYDYSIADDEKLTNAWLKHSVDPIDGNGKTGQAFWGLIASTYNSTSEPTRHRTAKQLKDRWNSNNPSVILFCGIYRQEERHRASGADDDMIMAAAKAKFKQRSKGNKDFKLEHWWHILRDQPKWLAKHIDDQGGSKRTRLGEGGEFSSGGGTSQEEVTARPIGRDRAKAALRKRKGKATSSESTGLPQAFSQMTVASDRLAKAKLWKIYYRMKAMPTTGMSARDLKRHEKDLDRLREDLDIPDEEDDEEEEDEEGAVGEEEDEEEEEDE